MANIRSKHNNLLNYFICNHKDLSKAYVRKCEKFLTRNKRAGGILPAHKHAPQATSQQANKPQATSHKHPESGIRIQASSDKLKFFFYLFSRKFFIGEKP